MSEKKMVAQRQKSEKVGYLVMQEPLFVTLKLSICVFPDCLTFMFAHCKISASVISFP